MPNENCPGCGDHTFPRVMHLTDAQASEAGQLLDSVEVRPYRPEQDTGFTTTPDGGPEAGMELPAGLAEPTEGFIIHPLAPPESLAGQPETPALIEGPPPQIEVPTLPDEQSPDTEVPSPPRIHFMNDNPSVEGDSVGNTPELLADDDCECTDAELDTSFGIDGWQWQADKEGTELGNEGNKTTKQQGRDLNRKSYDVAGKNFPNDPGRFYFAAKVKITVAKKRRRKKIPITVKAHAQCIIVTSYGDKANPRDDKLKIPGPCKEFFANALNKPAGEDAWIAWMRMIYQITPEEAEERVGEMFSSLTNETRIKYYEWTDYVPCESETYEIVAPIPPAPLGRDETVNPSVVTYSHVKHMCSLHVCGEELLGPENWKEDDRKLNVWDSSKGA